MNTEKLAYQNGLDLAAAERGYSSFAEFEKTAAPAWQRFLAEGGEAAQHTLARGGTGISEGLLQQAKHPTMSYGAMGKPISDFNTERRLFRNANHNEHLPTWALRKESPTGYSVRGNTGQPAKMIDGAPHERYPLAQGYTHDNPTDHKFPIFSWQAPSADYNYANYLKNPIPGI